MSYSAVIHYLCAIVGLSYDKDLPLCIEPTICKHKGVSASEFPLGKHSNSIRFKGTKVELFAPSITVDYAFPAMVSKTGDNGSSIWLTWMDYIGRKIGPYKMQGDDDIKIISLNDSEKTRNTMVPYAAPIQDEKRDNKPVRYQTEDSNPLERLLKYLRRAGIGFNANEDRITFLYEYYYIEFDRSNIRFELSSERSGVLATFPNTKIGIESLIKRIEKIERNFNAEKLLARA